MRACARDFARSMDHRHAFAAEENVKLTSPSDDSASLDEDGGVVEVTLEDLVASRPQ
jgi:hypothetical protein